jgi:hypothetical protein
MPRGTRRPVAEGGRDGPPSVPSLGRGLLRLGSPVLLATHPCPLRVFACDANDIAR